MQRMGAMEMSDSRARWWSRAVVAGFAVACVMVNWSGPGRSAAMMIAATALITLFAVELGSRLGAVVASMALLGAVVLAAQVGTVLQCVPLGAFVAVAWWRIEGRRRAEPRA